MLIRTTRTLSTWTMRALFYAALFAVVVLSHLAITTLLLAQGWGSGVAMLIAGAVVLAFVIVVFSAGEWLRDRLRERREMQRVNQRLPSGPCCYHPNEPQPGMPSTGTPNISEAVRA